MENQNNKILLSTNNHIVFGQYYEKSNIDVIDIFVLIIIALRFCYPLNAMFGNAGGYVIYYGAYLFFLLLAILFVNGFIYTFIKDLWIIFLLLIIVVIRSVLAGNMGFGFYDPMSMTISFLNIILAYSIFLYVRTKKRAFQRKVVITALVSLFISALVSLYYVVFVDYLAVRNAKQIYIGVGDFNLIYCLVFIPTILVPILLTKIRLGKRIRLFLYLLFFFTAFLILKAGFMTALVLFLFSICLTYFIGKHKFKVLPVFGLVFFIIFFLKESIGEYLIKSSENQLFSWVINEKIRAIGSFLIGNGENLDTLGKRIYDISYTLDSFISHPFFGVNFNDFGANTIGGHAQWFDDLATFGIVGMFLWILFYWYIYKQTVKKLENPVSNIAVKSAWLIFIILGFLNPNQLSTISMFLFAVIPFSGTILLKRGNEIENRK